MGDALPTNHISGRSFPRENRLAGRSDFLAVLHSRASQRLKGRYCEIICLKTDASATRFGIMLSKKVGCAVRRNRIKRVIREFIRNNKHIWPNNSWIVFSLQHPLDDDKNLIAEIKDMIANLK